MSGKPAARLTDMHTCPQTEGHIPHVGGPIVQGSPNVLINGWPAARVGDKLTCIGPSDEIMDGSTTVFINDKPAARMGDMTVHGGVIIAGCSTVLIGDTGKGTPCPRQASAMNAPFYDPS
ncbi:PAAR domain-containing protein [Swingsia samuiensis]|uniref:Type VI secretion protein n=1 Tax=Swingsia samuiensis TaxID=1293412 RepID=A0A4Y6UIE4_9PROT|nr:PAAR domain-containing protein [Swingsia samuiensis]QDH17379.1 type VI secretion protein [Swingsia samuiensis]